MKQTREIKFRIWDNHEKRTILWDEVKQDPEEFFPILSGGVNALIMQYTGLKDKNGKEIYEGDILSYQYYHDYGQWGKLENQHPIIVKWDESKASFSPFYYWKNYNDQLKTCVILGNIYENLELLTPNN